MIHISTFSGIGGAELAAEWAGWKNYASCEINEFGQRVLEYYWPDAYHHDDIKTLTYKLLDEELKKRHGEQWRNEELILTGGFPCQPFSLAGKRKGTEDNRNLWPEMLRVIREIHPDWIVGENVYGLFNWNKGVVFEQICADMEAEGYEVQPVILPACGVNAPHKRERIWFIAHAKHGRNSKRPEEVQGDREEKRMGQQYEIHKPEQSNDIRGFSTDSNSSGLQDGQCVRSNVSGSDGERGNSSNDLSEIKVNSKDASNSQSIGMERSGSAREQEPQTPTGPGLSGCNNAGNNWENWPTQSPLCGRNDELSSRLDNITFPKWRNESIKAYGNAWVPAVAYEIFKAINEFIKEEVA